MTVPKYFEMYSAFLDCLKDGQEHHIKDIKKFVAAKMEVSEEDREILLPSGRQTMYDNRLGWAKTYLKKAGLIENKARGVLALTKEGRKATQESGIVIDDNYLMKYPSFREFRRSNSAENVGSLSGVNTETPQEIFDKTFSEMNSSLGDELLGEIMKQSPAFFEYLVARLLNKMGYGGAVENSVLVTGQSGDEGIDAVIREDKLGFGLIYIQAKRWEPSNSVGRPEIQKFVGALAGQGAVRGLFITTAKFSKEAIAYAQKQHTTKVVLVDGILLTKLMIEYNLGVSTEMVYEIKKLDRDFFNDEME